MVLRLRRRATSLMMKNRGVWFTPKTAWEWFTLTIMRGRAMPLKMKDFVVTFTLTLMRRGATPMKMKDFVVSLMLTRSMPDQQLTCGGDTEDVAR